MDTVEHAFSRPPAQALEDDAVYRTIALYRRPGEFKRALAEAWPQGELLDARLTQTYYNPYSRARLVGEVSLQDDSPPQVLSIKIFKTKERAAEIYARACAKKALPTAGPPVLRLRDGHSVVWWLPNGQNLKKIGICYDRARFHAFVQKRGLAEGEEDLPLPRLLRYVPRRRAVFRWCSPTRGNVYFKFYALKRSASSAHNLRALKNLGPALSFKVPRIISYNKRRNVVMMEEVPGTPLTDLMPTATAQDLRRVGVALGSLHRASLELATMWTTAGEFQSLTDACTELARVLPALAPALESLRARLDGAHPLPSSIGPIHANLFGDQILVSPTHVGIVDWDDLSLGDPLYDLGRLAAHLIYLSLCDALSPERAAAFLEALLEGYAEVCGPADPDALRWHVAVALLLRAKISALRPLAPHWRTRIGDSVAAAQLVLEGKWLP